MSNNNSFTKSLNRYKPINQIIKENKNSVNKYNEITKSINNLDKNLKKMKLQIKQSDNKFNNIRHGNDINKQCINSACSSTFDFKKILTHKIFVSQIKNKNKNISPESNNNTLICRNYNKKDKINCTSYCNKIMGASYNIISNSTMSQNLSAKNEACIHRIKVKKIGTELKSRDLVYRKNELKGEKSVQMNYNKIPESKNVMKIESKAFTGNKEFSKSCILEEISSTDINLKKNNTINKFRGIQVKRLDDSSHSFFQKNCKNDNYYDKVLLVEHIDNKTSDGKLDTHFETPLADRNDTNVNNILNYHNFHNDSINEKENHNENKIDMSNSIAGNKEDFECDEHYQNRNKKLLTLNLNNININTLSNLYDSDPNSLNKSDLSDGYSYKSFNLKKKINSSLDRNIHSNIFSSINSTALNFLSKTKKIINKNNCSKPDDCSLQSQVLIGNYMSLSNLNSENLHFNPHNRIDHNLCNDNYNYNYNYNYDLTFKNKSRNKIKIQHEKDKDLPDIKENSINIFNFKKNKNNNIVNNSYNVINENSNNFFYKNSKKIKKNENVKNTSISLLNSSFSPKKHKLNFYLTPQKENNRYEAQRKFSKSMHSLKAFNETINDYECILSCMECNKKLKSEIEILTEKVKTFKKIQFSKSHEIELLRAKYSEAIENYKNEIEKNKNMKQNIQKQDLLLKKIKKNFKNCIGNLIDIIELLQLGKNPAPGCSSNKPIATGPENTSYSLDIYDSYNNEDEKKAKLQEQIQSLLIAKLLFFKKDINLNLDSEIEKIKSWSCNNIYNKQNIDNSDFSIGNLRLQVKGEDLNFFEDSKRYNNSQDYFDTSYSNHFMGMNYLNSGSAFGNLGNNINISITQSPKFIFKKNNFNNNNNSIKNYYNSNNSYKNCNNVNNLNNSFGKTLGDAENNFLFNKFEREMINYSSNKKDEKVKFEYQHSLSNNQQKNNINNNIYSNYNSNSNNILDSFLQSQKEPNDSFSNNDNDSILQIVNLNNQSHQNTTGNNNNCSNNNINNNTHHLSINNISNFNSLNNNINKNPVSENENNSGSNNIEKELKIFNEKMNVTNYNYNSSNTNNLHLDFEHEKYNSGKNFVFNNIKEWVNKTLNDSRNLIFEGAKTKEINYHSNKEYKFKQKRKSHIIEFDNISVKSSNCESDNYKENLTENNNEPTKLKKVFSFEF